MRLARRLWQWVCASCAYSKFLWQHEGDWDYSALLSLMQFKLARMRAHIREHDHIVAAAKVCAEIQMAEDYITCILDDSYNDEEYNTLEKKWGEPSWIDDRFDRPNIKTAKDRKQYDKEVRAWGRGANKAREQDWKKFWDYMHEHVRSWWD